MGMKEAVAKALILPLFVGEACELKEFPPTNRARGAAMSTAAGALAAPTHIHCEPKTEAYATAAYLLSTSSGRHPEENFRLHIKPAERRGFPLVAYPALNLWAIEEGRTQPMFGHCESIAALANVLSQGLELPPSQVNAICESAVRGAQQEVGGRTGTSVRLFRRSELERVGMTFRPPDC